MNKRGVQNGGVISCAHRDLSAWLARCTDWKAVRCYVGCMLEKHVRMVTPYLMAQEGAQAAYSVDVGG